MPGAFPAVTAVRTLGQREDRPQPREAFHRRIGSRVLVRFEERLAALRIAHGNGHQLVGETARVHGRDGAAMGLEREGILILAAHVLSNGDPFRVRPHMAVLGRAPKAVGHGRVDHGAVPEPHAEPRLRQEVRRAVHALHAAGDHEVRIARPDLGRGEHDRLHPRPTDSIDGRRGHR
jgi:hypothetical protein